MLDPSAVDLEMLTMAMEDHGYESSWWFDPSTGETLIYSSEFSPGDAEHEDEDAFEERGMIRVAPADSREGYRDMAIFTETVEDEQLNARLSRALQGRGSFRRFKDVLYDQDAVRREWLDFRDRRLQQRALRWLEYHKVISEVAAEAAIDALDDELAPEANAVTSIEDYRQRHDATENQV